MKKIFLIFATIVVAQVTYAQSIQDALRYSQTNTTGTARYRALGGAFGALGGDMSAISTNPASSAVFIKSAFSFSLANDNVTNEVGYNGDFRESDDGSLTFNQVGGVFVIEGNGNSKWKKVTLGLNYDRTQNFDNEFAAFGTSGQTIGDYFLNFAQGVPLDLLQLRDNESTADLYQFLGENEGFGAQQAFLGFQSFLIDPVDFDNPNGTTYISNVEGTSFTQDYLSSSVGYNGKAAFNIGAQYGENIYFGLNLNSHFFDYEQSNSLLETNTNATGITAIRFDNYLRTFGSGFSFQLGTIARVSKDIRLGLTYDSPTWFTISEEGSQRLITDRVEDDQVITEDIDPRVLNVYQDYEISTPGKYTGSIAYLFGQQGLISFDYSYTDYSQLSFRPKDDPFFASQNAAIDNQLKGAGTYKIGGEYRFEDWSFRGGYRLIESPYEDEFTIGELTGYSLGLGYNFGNVKFDVAYDSTEQDINQSLYSTGLTNAPATNRTNRSVVATLTFNL